MSAAALLALALAGCGEATAGSGGSQSAVASVTGGPAPTATAPSPAPTTGVPPSLDVPDPTITVDPVRPTTEPGPKEPTTYTGTIDVNSDFGACVTMPIEGRPHVLIGKGVSALRTGERVTLEGSIRTDVATTCQLGPVFEVTRIYAEAFVPAGKIPTPTPTS